MWGSTESLATGHSGDFVDDFLHKNQHNSEGELICLAGYTHTWYIQGLPSECLGDSGIFAENSPVSSDGSEDYIDEKPFGAEEGSIVCLWIDCRSKFNSQDALVRHVEQTHVETRREDFNCFWSGCPRRNRPFNARYKLLIHMRVHTGYKPNKCPHKNCTKAFSRLENLKIHLRSHTGERPYICPHCPKAFSNSSDRAKHQRTHFNKKPYACTFPSCGKRYTDPSSLRKHSKVHSGQIWANSFSSSSSSSSSAASFGSASPENNRFSPVLSIPSPHPIPEIPDADLFPSVVVPIENDTSAADDMLNNLVSEFDWISKLDLGDVEQFLNY